jgi:thiamine biosynthesis protein ThiS
MIVMVNGEQTHVSDGAAVVEVIAALGLKPERVAVEVNHKIVRRADWSSTALGEGDRVEIVHFVGGGACGAFIALINPIIHASRG